jgi:hypothetical protein
LGIRFEGFFRLFGGGLLSWILGVAFAVVVVCSVVGLLAFLALLVVY